ncbi:DUF6543 domain-containing protein [Pseudomonas sp. OA65]|uniref:dermonecrotic toxin domain-containing protein n=1 Tax=Pseudomonas sp. OA65 TaxID=2818431 RepID=UPI001A9D1499|nr:DUF6543 domain-containing protein [Pseudomonas sp. OA65]MBO1539474.1 hypothetical protein [Pseudomonas sp. OA65]
MTSPTPADSPATFTQTVSQQFANRPTFEYIAQQMLEKAIKAAYPTLTIDLSTVQLAMPDSATIGWAAQPFMPLVLDYLALGTPVDFSSKGERDCYLCAEFPKRLRDADGKTPNIKVIETLLLELPLALPIGLEHALTRYWNAQLAADSHTSRWQWLSDTLKHILHVRGLQQPGLSEPERDTLEQIARWPDREQRFRHAVPPVYAYSLESTITQGDANTVLPAQHILLLHYTRHGLIILLCSPGSAVRSFASLDRFHAYWTQRIADRYVVDTVTCQRYEISGNVFETQAGMLLEQQLSDLRSVKLPSDIGWADLKALYSDLSDPTRYLTDIPRISPQASKPLMALLPDWLRTAPLLDQTTFQHYSLALAGAKQRGDGKTFLSGIEDIRAFTIDALSSRMQKINDSSQEKVHASQFHPDEVTLTYTVVAGYPGAVGISETREMSLTDLAIDNLVARPSGHVRLSHRKGLALPQWLTNDFITRQNGLIEQVDIGTTYPTYLQQALLLDDSERRSRERRFAEQIPAQLVLEALKQMHDKQYHITRQGLDLVEALFALSAEDRQVDGRPVVIRHLALHRKPQATPDTVLNMFLIESKDSTTGPHLLYRPFYAPSLQQFTSRQALMDAIATAGALQDSVLTWLPDTARPVYANGGFKEPHVVHFYQGDEFSVPDRPVPATLAVDEASGELLQYLGKGELMQYLYGCNARALVAQADRASVSNSESRWALLLKGGSLLFNTLLFPLLRGPAMSCVWLFNLMLSAKHDIPALTSEDPVARELAAVDLLLNLALLAVQVPSARVPARAPVTEPIKEQAMRAPAPRAIPEQWPAPAAPKYIEGIVALPGEQSHAPTRALDFSFANPRHRLTLAQRAQLREMQVGQPSKLPEPISYGPLKGLYVIDNQWHAMVEHVLYRVDIEPEGSAQIIDTHDPNRNGPMLKSDSQGNWTLDLELRLRGGMEETRLADLRAKNSKRREKLENERVDYLNARVAELERAKKAYQKVVDNTHGIDTTTGEKFDSRLGPKLFAKQRTENNTAFYKVLKEQTAKFRKMLNSIPERKELNIPLERALVAELLINVIQKADLAYLLVSLNHSDLMDAYPEFVNGPPADASHRSYSRFETYASKSAEIREIGIYWLKLRDRYQEELMDLDAAGTQDYKKVIPTLRNNDRSVMGEQGGLLAALSTLTIQNGDSDLLECLYRLMKPLTKQMRAHSDIQRYTLSRSEQLTVLDSLVEQYGKILDSFEVMKVIYAENINETYFNKMFDLVKSLYEDASKRLMAEAKPESKPKPKPHRRPNKPSLKASNRKVIKTRNGDVLIGEIRKVEANPPFELVEVRSEDTQQIIETYSEKQNDVWDVVVEERPTPVPKTRSFNAIKGDALKLLDHLDEHLSRAEGYKKRCRHPQEIEEIMSNEADRYRKLSADLDRTLSGRQPTAQEEALRTDLNTAILRLTEKGRELRTQLSWDLPPTDGNLRYLFEKKLVQVARLDQRIASKGARKDFYQEYSVSNLEGKIVWYAHFHYEKFDTPKAEYAVAHLKRYADRKKNYYSELANANNPHAVVEVYRGSIGKALAQEKFLVLAP